MRHFQLLLVAICAGASLLAALIYMRSATFLYTAEVRVAAISNIPVAFEAGLDDWSPREPIERERRMSLYIDGLHSRTVAEELARDPQIMRKLFPDALKQAAGKREDQARRGSVVMLLARLPHGSPPDEGGQPDAADLQRYLARHLWAERYDHSTLIRFEHTDPAFALYFVAKIDRAVDGMLRRRIARQAAGAATYFASQMQSVRSREQLSHLRRMVAEQSRRQLTTSSAAPYFVEPVDLPRVPRAPSSPQPIGSIIMATLSGAILGLVLSMLTANRGSSTRRGTT